MPERQFPYLQPDSDLYVMDLATRKLRRLEINSDQADTWHSWSSNSRWVVFSSKRIDGLLARPYFSYVDQQGEFHKPFVLPQEDPSFYGFCLNTFNVPELMRGPVTVKERDLARAVIQPRKVLTPLGPAGPSSPGSIPVAANPATCTFGSRRHPLIPGPSPGGGGPATSTGSGATPGRHFLLRVGAWD